ncbi:MAG: sugar phosphate isomerase/epimerase [Planctomycetes bacterium]|nr:sugar phosphate isomerase/epimerase [Planctomycetota bacterium]
MKLSVMLFPFHKKLTEGPLTPERVVKGFQSVGIQAIEPMMSWVEAEPEKWETFFKTANDAGMVWSCYDIGVNLIGESEVDRTEALVKVDRGIAFCKEKLNSSLVLLAGTKPAPNMSNEDGRKIYGEQLAKAYERTKNSGVTITIEDFGVYPPFTAGGRHCLETLEASNCPAIKFTFDNGNFLFADDTPTGVYDLFKGRIAHVHIKDFALREPDDQPRSTSLAGKQYKGCLIGDGEAEVVDTVKLLKADAYDGWISLEVGGSIGPLDDALHGAKVVKEAWGEA